MYCQPPLQSWGTFSLKKRSYIPAEIDRTVLPWSQCLAWQRRPHGQASQMPAHREAGVRACCGLVLRLPAASLPSALCARARTRLSHVAGRHILPPHPFGRVMVGLDRCTLAALSLAFSCKSITASPCLLPRPGTRRRKNLLKSLLPFPPFLILCPWMAVPFERHPRRGHPTISSFSFPQTPQSGVFFRVLFISGNCNTQSMLLFAKCNYQRPCVYGWGMVESNRKWLFFVLKAFFISGAVGTSAAFSEWHAAVLLSSKINDLICWCLVLEMTFMWNKRDQINNKKMISQTQMKKCTSLPTPVKLFVFTCYSQIMAKCPIVGWRGFFFSFTIIWLDSVFQILSESCYLK